MAMGRFFVERISSNYQERVEEHFVEWFNIVCLLKMLVIRVDTTTLSV